MGGQRYDTSRQPAKEDPRRSRRSNYLHSGRCADETRSNFCASPSPACSLLVSSLSVSGAIFLILVLYGPHCALIKLWRATPRTVLTPLGDESQNLPFLPARNPQGSG